MTGLDAADQRRSVEFTGIVLAGGESRRMGTDKALLPVDSSGRLLVQIAAAALHDAGATEVIVVGGDDAAFRRVGLDTTPDMHPGEGPLGGLITAMHRARSEVLVALACDHTGASAEAVARLLALLEDHDVVVAQVDGRLQIMHAVWRVSALPVLEEIFASGHRRLRDPLEHLSVRYVADLPKQWFRSANNPEEFQRAFGETEWPADPGVGT